MSKAKEHNEISLTILNEMTYLNIWANFSRWVSDQTSAGSILSIHPLGIIVNIHEKTNAGINLKISDSFLNDYGLRWDETRFNCEKECSNSTAPHVKLNAIVIGSNLNVPKIYIQNGLQNIFRACLVILSENKTSVVEMGVLGNIYCQNKAVFQVPCKLKKDIISNKKITIRTLIERPILLDKTSGKNKVGALEIGKRDKGSDDTPKEHYAPPNLAFSHVGNSNNNLLSNLSALDYKSNKNSYTFGKTANSMNDVDLAGLHPDKPTLKKTGKVVLIPMPKEEKKWNLADMINCTFTKNTVFKNSIAPVLFNVYSNTRAAPFTGEKTQIPLSHRIGSFYSLPLQNFVIDKTTKCIKRLADEYFTKIFSFNFEQPASEIEEFQAYLNRDDKNYKVALRKSIYKTYQELIRTSISNSYISDIKESWLVNIIKMCLRAYNLDKSKNYDFILKICFEEIMGNYQYSMKKSIIDYMLKHPEQREKLKVSIPFRKIKEYAEANVIRPSDNNLAWKTNWNISKLKISNNLMIMSENITKILKYYSSNLKNTTYLSIPQPYVTMNLNAFIEMQKNKLDEQRKVIGEEWKKYVEMTLKENKIYKDQLIIYFKSVSGVMSTEMRNLIISSLKKFHYFICQFKKQEGQYHTAEEVFSSQFKSSFGFEQSFLEISIQPVKNKQEFVFSEDLKDIHNKIISLVQDVIKCSRDVERPDNMFIKNLEKQASLWEVPINDPEVTLMINDIDIIVKDNIDIIEKVLELYSQFKFVITEKQMLMDEATLEQQNNQIFSSITSSNYPASSSNNVIQKSGEPTVSSNTPAKTVILTIKYIEEKIKLYEEKIKVLEQEYPNCIYMNMIKVDCSEVNAFLLKELKECIEFLLKYIFTENISNKSKMLIDEVDNKLKDKLSKTAETEENLHNMEQEFEEDKAKKIPELYETYAEFLEWVFFYLKYDTYPVGIGSSKVGSNEVGGSLEKLVIECFNSVKNISSLVYQFHTNNIIDKKSMFESNLNKKREKMAQEINAILARWKEIKDGASEAISQEENVLIDLQSLNDDIDKTMKKLEELHVTENLLGTYNTEDEKLQLCVKEFTPLLNFLLFTADMRHKINTCRSTPVKNLDFNILTESSDKAKEMIELIKTFHYIKRQKFNSMQKEMENFRNTVEFGKHINNLIDIVKTFEEIDPDLKLEDNKSIIEENRVYCQELTKFLGKKDVGQDYLKNITYNHLTIELESYLKNKEEIQRIVSEWDVVREIFNSISKIAVNFEVSFETTNYKDKIYKIIKHDSFTKVKYVVQTNLDELNRNLEGVESFKNPSITVEKMKKFRLNITELNQMISNMEEIQKKLEICMSISDNYANMDYYTKLKLVSKIFIYNPIGRRKL